MASIMEQQQGVSQGRRRAEKSKISLQTEFRFMNLLLLFCFFNYSESPSAGNTSRRMMKEKRGDVTLPCEFQATENLDISLMRQKKNILFCEKEKCESENDRLQKKGTCDIIIKDLIFSDAGKYILSVHYTDGPRKMEYHLHIHDEISVKTGEQLKMDVLLINADKVEKNSSGEWTEVWTRGHGVSSDRLTDRDGNLTISNFTVSDTGTYRVLDSEGEIWITVTVTESNLKNTDEDETDSEHHTVGYWIVAVGLTVILVLFFVILAAVVFHERLRDHVQCVDRRRKERLSSGDPESLKGSIMISVEGLENMIKLYRTHSDITG